MAEAIAFIIFGAIGRAVASNMVSDAIQSGNITSADVATMWVMVGFVATGIIGAVIVGAIKSSSKRGDKAKQSPSVQACADSEEDEDAHYDLTEDELKEDN